MNEDYVVISVAEFLVILVCTAGMFLILALGAWILFNRSRLERSGERQSRLDALDREYAAGDIDDAEYERRRSAILNESES